jgi:hypothetical protein
LSDAGLSDITSLEEIGIITGSASDEVAQRLRKIPGVVDVSPSGEIGIGPPNSKTTW